jgi:hypothetical protein
MMWTGSPECSSRSQIASAYLLAQPLTRGRERGPAIVSFEI